MRMFLRSKEGLATVVVIVFLVKLKGAPKLRGHAAGILISLTTKIIGLLLTLEGGFFLGIVHFTNRPGCALR